LVYYLNDDYTGGEINFSILGIKIKPVKNQLIIFPSNYIYRHSVEEVTKGTRYSVVTWLA
jgi:predicted 2-oxoglutarate/Fe(II)-dependent dioxygenase YbiX